MKSEIIHALGLARKSHLQWVVYADHLVKGVDKSEAKKPLDCTKCEFGEWYYSRGVKINNLPGFKKIEALHEDFHKAYLAIYYKRFDRRGSPSSRKIFRIKNHLPKPKEVSLEESFETLKKRFKALHKETQALEKMVNVMSEKLFAETRF